PPPPPSLPSPPPPPPSLPSSLPPPPNLGMSTVNPLPALPPPQSPPPIASSRPTLPSTVVVVEVYVAVFESTYVETVDIRDILANFKSKVSTVIGVPASKIFISKVFKNGTDISAGYVDRRRMLVQQLVLQQTLMPYSRKDDSPQSWAPEEVIGAAAFGDMSSEVMHLTRTRRFLAKDPTTTEWAMEASEKDLLHYMGLVAGPAGNILRSRDNTRHGAGNLRKLMGSVPLTSDDCARLSSDDQLAIEFYTQTTEFAPLPPSPPSPPPRPPNPPGVMEPPSSPDPPPPSPSRPPPFSASSLMQILGASSVYQYTSPPPKSPPPWSPPQSQGTQSDRSPSSPSPNSSSPPPSPPSGPPPLPSLPSSSPTPALPPPSSPPPSSPPPASPLSSSPSPLSKFRFPPPPPPPPPPSTKATPPLVPSPPQHFPLVPYSPQLSSPSPQRPLPVPLGPPDLLSSPLPVSPLPSPTSLTSPPSLPSPPSPLRSSPSPQSLSPLPSSPSPPTSPSPTSPLHLKPARKPSSPSRAPPLLPASPSTVNSQPVPPSPPNQKLIIEVYILVIDASGGLTVLEVMIKLKDFKEKAARAHGVPVSQIFISEVWIDGEDITSGLVDRRRSLLAQELLQQDSETPYNNAPHQSWSAVEINSAFGSDASDVMNLIRARRFAANDPVAARQALEASEEALFRSLGSASTTSHDRILSSSDSDIDRNSVGGGIMGGRQLVQREIPITSDDGSVLSLDGKLTIEYSVLSYEDVPQPPSPPPPSPKPPNPPGMKNPLRPPRNTLVPKPPPWVPSRPTPFNADVFLEELGATEIYHVLRPPSTPQQPPSPPLPPSQPPELTTFVRVNDMPGHGAKGAARPIVWWDDADFSSQLRPYKALQLVDWNKRPCPILPNVCGGCTRAWRAQKASTVVTVFFREPVQIDEIKIFELKHPSVSLVRLLAWPINPTSPNTPATGHISYEYLGSPVYNATTDSPTGVDPTKCNDALVVTLPPNRAGTLLPVPEWGSQENLPNRLSRTAVAGVEVTVKAPRTPALATFIESIRFKGRVLYPKDPRVYEAWV
ncbi:hypothetical protein Vretimale_16738, partial [Volvox reticuliferus]